MPIDGVRPGRLLTAGVLGASSWWVWAAIIVLSTYITLPVAQHLIQASRGLDISLEAWRFAIRVVNAVVRCIAYGIVFGLPLGFFAAGRTWLYWLVFAAGAFVGSFLASLTSPFGSNSFSLAWSYPEAWLALFAVACFAYVGGNIRNRVERRRDAAPYRLAFAATSALLIASIAGVGWYLVEFSG